MAYTSLGFLAFLGIVILVYYLVPKKYQWAVLLTASYIFYLFSGVAQLAFILGTTAVTYFAALLMQKKRDAYKAELAAIGPEITREQKQELKKEITGEGDPSAKIIKQDNIESFYEFSSIGENEFFKSGYTSLLSAYQTQIPTKI